MGKSPMSLSSILFLVFHLIISIDFVTSSCPVDFGYIQTLPWNTSLCREPVDRNCCQTILSLWGIGLAKNLKKTSMFYFPDTTSSSSCLSNFQSKLTYMSIPQYLVPKCLENSTQYVVNPSSCAGITTTQDWVQKLGPTTQLDTSCNGDLTGLTRCGRCSDAGLKVNSQLVSLNKNSTRCFYYSIFYAAGIVNEFGPEDIRTAACILGLPLSISATSNSSNHLYKWVFGSIGALIGVLISGGLIMVYRMWDKKKKQKALHQDYVTSVRARVLPNTSAKWFQLAELEHATNGFPQRNLIGQGGYGVVYKGILMDGTVVAVKQILDLDSKGDEEFVKEVEIISKIRHRNLLSLRGCCVTSDDSKGKRRYLVYDFMPNGSLNDHLFNSEANGCTKKKQLSWPQRKNIILDVAKGLAYLHHGIKPAIYHRDIKGTNILLDSDFKARVADFGLAKQSLEGQSHLTTRVAGTYGYLAPEYALYGQLTEKSDVYSFGIVILETMSGRKVLDTTTGTSSTLLITDWAWMLVKSGNVMEVFDEYIREEGPRGVMERFILVGILCAHVMVALRPTIDDALKMLEGDIDIPRIPDRPLPLSHESFRSSLQYTVSLSERSRAISSISSM